MKVVLDTNALLVSIPSRSVYRPIFDAILQGDFDLIISNDILSEYVEVIERITNAKVAINIVEMLLGLDNLYKAEVYFNWKLIDKDPDDNKYVDAAIVGSADVIVTNDYHFNVLKTVNFPKVNVMNIEDFLFSILNK